MSKKKKGKNPKTNPIPQTPKVEVIPPDLKLKWDGCGAVATAFGVLDKGYFPHSYGAAVKASLQFLAKLHENMVQEALSHPAAHMIPELNEVLKSQKEKKDTNAVENSAETATQ